MEHPVNLPLGSDARSKFSVEFTNWSGGCSTRPDENFANSSRLTMRELWRRPRHPTTDDGEPPAMQAVGVLHMDRLYRIPNVLASEEWVKLLTQSIVSV